MVMEELEVHAGDGDLEGFRSYFLPLDWTFDLHNWLMKIILDLRPYFDTLDYASDFDVFCDVV